MIQYTVDSPNKFTNQSKSDMKFGSHGAENFAATKIQAAFRGSQSRKRHTSARKKVVFRTLHEIIILAAKDTNPFHPDGYAFVNGCRRFARTHATATHVPAFVRGFRALLEAQLGQSKVMAWRVRPTIFTRSVSGEGDVHRWSSDAVELMATCALWRTAAFAPVTQAVAANDNGSTKEVGKDGVTTSAPFRFRWECPGEKAKETTAEWVVTSVTRVPSCCELNAEVTTAVECEQWLIWSMDPRINDNQIEAALAALKGMSSSISIGLGVRNPVKELSGEIFTAHYKGQPPRLVNLKKMQVELVLEGPEKNFKQQQLKKRSCCYIAF